VGGSNAPAKPDASEAPPPSACTNASIVDLRLLEESEGTVERIAGDTWPSEPSVPFPP